MRVVQGTHWREAHGRPSEGGGRRLVNERGASGTVMAPVCLLRIPWKKDVKKETHIEAFLERTIHTWDVRINPLAGGQVRKVWDHESKAPNVPYRHES